MFKYRRFVKMRNLAWGVIIASPAVAYFTEKSKYRDTTESRQKHHKPARYWQVRAYELIPLRGISRMWGSFNDITLPEWLRPLGFRLYSLLFGVNLTEMADQDLKNYKNLGEFFYRQLRPGVRPISDALVVAPSDGKVLQFGEILDDQYIEQVKGINYKVDGLLGSPVSPVSEIPHNNTAPVHENKGVPVQRHEKFAELNGLDYTIDDIVGKAGNSKLPDTKNEGIVGVDAGEHKSVPTWSSSHNGATSLFYCVVYLAPGDYHRFHSPVNWVVNKRRHFVGELFSVAPFIQNRMSGLFCVNERVALLGRWKYGFFSMTPVGATNVGSIVINFDSHLRTNRRGELKNHCYEASYASASSLYRGYPVLKGEEMGGFKLGSTVVLVFEAPREFMFKVERGSIVQMGEELGEVTK